MSVRPDELLDRIATTLREQIGPAVGEPFAKTQAFMAAVILTKLASQLRATETDRQLVAEERRAVIADIRGELAETSTTHVGDAVAVLGHDGSDTSWGVLVEALYTDREELGAVRFERMLHRVRVAMRSRLDRALGYSS